MPIYVVLFEDRADADPNIRRDHMPAHLAFLEGNAAAIAAAGPLRDADGTGAGGLWIVEVSDRAAVDDLVREDPFWSTGLRQSYRVLEWTRVFVDGQRRV